ncbi:DUF5009 domain-containing protein [Pedobacter sp. SD-b]|uniref:DUF5009 domain-containing protein n=1 Tax=Pedobacter segetis TaxID=2793069 RepID=A0ABS1BL87_9SPHI|nr:DUF5009 domain-containing protein [Pedobacter segetis]MBK0383653.1 DUF5009 domain-containing protein [Pedobacter segetis]
MDHKLNEPIDNGRLLSLDVMRGLIMILLAGESCLVYESLNHVAQNTIFSYLTIQFFHHPWHGLHFWDLVQPAFMMMAGSAMYLSYHSKLKKGISWSENLKHILIRSLKLFLLGTGLHCVYADHLVFELWNVLTQLAFTTVIAYLIINKSFTFQIAFSIVLLLITEFLYRYIQVPDFSQPFTEFHNFGAYADTLLMGKINTDGWVAINIIPTAAHTIWGVLAAKVLMSKNASQKPISILLMAGVILLVLGFSLDISNITPIIKRISTSSFTLASGGWVILILAALYWFCDIKKYNRYAWVFVSIGMNAIFIYLFFETLGAQWFNDAVRIFTQGFLGFFNTPKSMMDIVNAFVVLFLEWYMCFWLYQRKAFIKI